MTSTVGALAYKAKVDEHRRAKEHRRRRQAEQLRAKALVGCDSCRASKAEIQGEQARLRREFYARHPELVA